MARYEISNTKSGLVLGTFEGETEAEAIAAMHRDAGYDREDELAGIEGGENLVAREVRSKRPEHTHKVVTWTTPSGDQLDICTACEDRLHAAREWPRNDRGEEYCQVSFGLHQGVCHFGPAYRE